MRNAGIRALLSHVVQSESCDSTYTQTEMANLLRGKCLLPQLLSTLLLKQGFPVNLELAGLAKLTIPEILLSPPPQHWNYRHAPLLQAF